MSKKNYHKIFLVLIIASLTSCAPDSYTAHVYGFFGGIWHGIIWGFALIGKLIGLDVGLFADNNTGFTYWLGFIIGLGGLGGGAASRR